MSGADDYFQFRLSSERKERWEQEVEQSTKWRNLTDLIIQSVEQSLRDEPGAVGAPEVDLGAVHDRFDDLGDQLDDIEDRLDETYFLVREEESNYTEITARVQDIIPEVEGGDERDSLLADSPPPANASSDADSLEVASRTGSVAHLVRYLQEDEGFKAMNVKDAVERLAEHSSTVEAAYANPQDEEDMRVFRRVD